MPASVSVADLATAPPLPDAERMCTRPTLSVAEATERAAELARDGRRRLLGLVGPPGAGKSTLSAAQQARLGESMVVVGMDGFHLANTELLRLGRRDRKGAPDTFDVDGYAALLARLRSQPEPVIYAPVFDRELDESVGSAIPVPREVPLVITEGNYLLHDGQGWQDIRTLLDEVWFIDLAPDERLARLIARRRAYGESYEQAAQWAHGSDQVNAITVESSKHRADLIVHLTTNRA